MPTTATITPTLGAAPVSLQAGNYSAIDDRRFWSSGVREGVISGGSYQVIQRAAGANMTVDVASSVGSGAVVQGDSVTAQGNYFVPPTAANVNVDIAASDATNPRNDLVVLEVKDDQHDAGGLNLARVRVITGTANASAGANDAPGANGTPALPSSCLLLAVVRVTAAATTVTTAMINDRRPWAGGVPTFETSLPSPAADGQVINYRADSTNGIIWQLRYRNAFNGGSATYPWEFIGGRPLHLYSGANATASLTANTWSNISTAQTITAPLAGEYLASFTTACQFNVGGSRIHSGIRVDTTDPTVDTNTAMTNSGGNAFEYMAQTRLVTLTAASKDLTVRFYLSANNGTVARQDTSFSVLPARVG